MNANTDDRCTHGIVVMIVVVMIVVVDITSWGFMVLKLRKRQPKAENCKAEALVSRKGQAFSLWA